MAVELTLQRKQNTPWGFRLAGGADQGLPLTVIKVHGGSIAEEAGMQEGDLLVRVGNQPTAGLNHHHVQDLLKQAGNNFAAAVIRGKLPEDLVDSSKENVSHETQYENMAQSVEIDLKTTVTDETVIEYQEGVDEEVEEINQMSFTENMLQLSNMIESEIISNGHISPSMKENELLKYLDEHGGIDEEMRKKMGWTTFLQKPVPKPKSVDITEIRILSPVSEEVTVTIKRKTGTEETEEAEVIEEARQEIREEFREEIEEEFGQTEEIVEERTSTEVELSLEEQLAAIQRQLVALSRLPATIQQTLDVVTQQLTKIVGATEGKDEQDDEADENAEQSLGKEERSEGDLETEENAGEEAEALKEEEEIGKEETADADIREEVQAVENVAEEERAIPAEAELTPEEQEAAKLREEEMEKKQKEQQLLEELRQRRVKERPSQPLTPLERPIFLPGGRRWRLPEDANPPIRHPDMSDELIAETISGQSEIITGTTLGINFLKFEPPPKPLDHLRNSEVYKLIHDMEEPSRGVGARRGKVMAAEDYYAQVQKQSSQSQEFIQQRVEHV